ncbi:unnamed protein product [Didymodactylos carnosus]|uniref:PNPLA domain-containing protein n=1 Tax=Didymodactylos carnosus TaxID=1234261 RepID=A0A814YK70_9BILA|nr:unnamed protein product [Didymodactylos carnosus]CAF1229787.1 unnamed protein product [Didymodactylos carnosus]CAF3673144.1 unnamed protein product [Didymodactylos carnosus]CAF3992492.1 unnamed protein product [Didymodactylos carnosus]
MSSLCTLLTPSSQISSRIRCQNCGIQMNQVSWKQCVICKKFNLCDKCALRDVKLESEIIDYHTQLHKNIGNHESIGLSECMQWIHITEDVEDVETREKEFSRIMNENIIRNDYDMSVVIATLKEMGNRSQSPSEQQERQQLASMIVDYHTQGYGRNIRVLSLDGGGIRGYMPLQILSHVIAKKYLPDIQFNSDNSEHRERFKQVQSQFTNNFDYFVGTSTGGLIAFCLAVNYSILDMKELYSNFPYYFKRNWLGPLLSARYDPSRIHAKIDEAIGTITLKNGKQLSAENATLLDIRNFLNPDRMINDDELTSLSLSHGNLLEFVDDTEQCVSGTCNIKVNRVKREKVLLIPAYNSTISSITMFNTSYAAHWHYRIADVLKATMAAPAYFPPHKLHKGNVENGHFVPDKHHEIFIDGGVFANDPELTALWAIRMQWKKMVNYHLLSIGTGHHVKEVSAPTWSGYLGWLNKGLLVNTLMEATRSFTEIITNNLAKFNDIKRMKFNFRLKKSMPLDDPSFVYEFDKEWKILKNGEDFQALITFYNKYIDTGPN